MSAVPNITALGRWLRSWIQPEGAIHGFHNHPVQGDNPYLYGDFTCGHSTFASPLLAALAVGLRDQPDERGAALLCRMVDFQCGARQEDGQFAHIGFQAGETLKKGLFHNLMPCVALSQTAYLADTALGEERVYRIRDTVRDVLRTCAALYGEGATANSLCHEEYLRQWANLEFSFFFEGSPEETIRRNLEFLVDSFHVYGVPDDDSEGTLRTLADRDTLEPAQNYGLMLFPLVEAGRRYEETLYLEAARAIARHVVRSAWTDKNQQRRLHRDWARWSEYWSRTNQPMLIGGAGLTLAGVQNLHNAAPSSEIEAFLVAMDATYAFYQHPAGFFVAASGWNNEADIIPSTAWQSHDLLHLLIRHGTPPDFWEEFFKPEKRAAALLGPNLIWMETEQHWTVRGYVGQHGLELAGRKDTPVFGVDVPAWMESGREIPAEWRMPEQPAFARTNDGILQTSGREDVSRMEV